MNARIDREYLIQTLEKLLNVPSPVGYYVQLNPVLVELARDLGYSVQFDNKSTAYITLDGENNEKTVLLGAHADTLGFMVRHIEANGMLCIKRLGGGCMPSLEGETVTVFTRDGRSYSGMVICKSHSVHVFDDAHTLERNENTLRILLDEDVKSKSDVLALGIQNGDVIAVDPRFQTTENGYVRSRYLDDKAGIACIFSILKYLKENGLRPQCRTVFAFPYYEEIGMGGTYIPHGISEHVAVDIGLIGPNLEGNERSVSICAKDASMPYDYELTSRLIRCAEAAGCRYAVDLFHRYGSDASASLRAGNNVKCAAFGMAVYNSHGMERTHMEGLENTAKLILSYVLGSEGEEIV